MTNLISASPKSDYHLKKTVITLFHHSKMAKILKTSYNIAHQVESFFTGTEILFEQDGEHFYCAYGSTVNKVSVNDGQVKAQITTKNEDDSVLKFTLTNNDEILIIAYHSGLITKFNLLDETIQREFKSIHSAPISVLKTNSSNTVLATASSDGTVKLWNLVNHYCSHNLKGVNGVITCLEFHESDQEDLLFCAGGDDCIHIFELSSSQRIAKLSTHCSTITDLKVSFDGKKLISVGRDKIAVIWNISRGEKQQFGTSIRTIPLYESVESIALIQPRIINEILKSSIDDERVIFSTIGEEGIIKFWDAQSGSKILSQGEPPLCKDRNPARSCLQLCKRPNHNQLCAVSAERDVFIYDLPKLELMQQLQGHLDEILSACWFANDRYLAMACNSNDLKVMEVTTSRSQHLRGHSDIVLCVRAVPTDPMCIISSSKDCDILVWKFTPDTMSASIIFRGTGHTHAVHSIGVCISEKIFFTGGEDTTLKRWLMTEKPSSGQSDKNAGPSQLIASQTIKAHEARIDDIAISPNDQLVATGSRDKTARIFSTSGLQAIATLKGHRRGVYAVRFSPVDQVIVTAADVSLRMWNLQDFSCVKTFQGHDCAVLNFSFLSSGLQMLSIGSDGNMKLWDCKTNECTRTIDAHSGNTWTLALTNDDDRIVTGGQDEKLIIWKDTTEEEKEERLEKLQTQVVQEQDFMNYINKKKWRKALKMAITMENQSKTLSVLREILLEPTGREELEELLEKCRLDQVNFIIECCLTWTSTAKNSSVGQQVLNILIRRHDNDKLVKLPGLISSMDQLRILTEKSFDRYERLVQQATFVDFFSNSFRIN